MSNDKQLREKSPNFNNEEIKKLSFEKYRLKNLIECLPSERDQNFLFENVDSNERFILKVSNIDEDEQVIDMFIKVVQHLNHRSKTIKTVDGEYSFRYKSHLVRLVQYLPGRPLAKFQSIDKRFYTNLGQYLGELDRSLQTFSHPSSNRSIYWNITNGPTIIELYKQHIVNDQQRSIVETIKNHWKDFVEPNLTLVRMSIIHNDANDHNIILIDEDKFDLIDFGDMCYTYTIAEVSIACAYSMLNDEQPLDIARFILSSYHRINPLNSTEQKLVLDFIFMRLAMSVTISSYERSIQPENDYLFISEQQIWNLLENLMKFDRKDLENRFLSFY